MKKLFVHIGYPRTGTTTLQTHLFPNHSQINYLGRHPRSKPYIKFVDLISNLNDGEFKIRLEELKQLCLDFRIIENKTNILSSEFITLHNIHYNDGKDSAKSICRTLSRIEFLFNEINIDVNFFCSIRNQSTIIPSLYLAASPELNKSLRYDGEQIVNFLNVNKSNDERINRLFNGLKYWELFNSYSKVSPKKKLKFFLYEKFNEDFPILLSNYLNINSDISVSLIKGRSENSYLKQLNENPSLNKPFSVIFTKLKKNFYSPEFFFENFDKKIINLKKLIQSQFSKKHNKEIDKSILIKEKIATQLNLIKRNSHLIKAYFKEDNYKLKEELNLDIDKYDYF